MSNIASLDTLRCFLAAARALNFRRAARTVALTPTAFGQRIQKLEEQIGCRLFVRSTRSVTLTEKGMTLVAAAERCVAAADECERVGRGEANHPPMDLVLGTRQELGMSWILPQRRTLMQSRPGLNLHLYFSSGPDLHLRIRTLEIDCAVTSSPLNDPKLDAINLHREDYAFVAAKKLVARRPLRRSEDAAAHTLIDASPELPLFRYFRDAPKGGGTLHFAGASWMGSIAAIRRLVLDGAGVAVLPEYFIRRDLASKTLVRLFPEVPLQHDYFRLVFRAVDPRRAVIESIARDLVRVPLR